MKKRLTFAIIGLGRAGSIHFQNIFLSNLCVIKYALDIEEEKLNYFSENYPNNQISYLPSCHFSKILDDPELDVVVITTPTVCHESEVLLALEKGKSVFCEKPISSSVESIKLCYELAVKHKVVLHCSMNRRFDPSLQRLHQAIQNNELGRIHMIKTCSRDHPRPSIDYLKISNGIFHDCGVHDLDFVCWLLGRKPISVYVNSFTNDPEITSINDSETVVISLTFDDGTLGVIDLSRQSTYGYDQRVEIHGDKGMIESLNQRPNNVQLSNCNGTLLSPLMHSFASRYRDSYNNSLMEFINCVNGRLLSSVKAEEIVMLTKLANACEQSCKNHEIIKLD